MTLCMLQDTPTLSLHLLYLEMDGQTQALVWKTCWRMEWIKLASMWSIDDNLCEIPQRLFIKPKPGFPQWFLWKDDRPLCPRNRTSTGREGQLKLVLCPQGKYPMKGPMRGLDFHISMLLSLQQLNYHFLKPPYNTESH